jgi:hypothetical protein
MLNFVLPLPTDLLDCIEPERESCEGHSFR